MEASKKSLIQICSEGQIYLFNITLLKMSLSRTFGRTKIYTVVERSSV